MIFCTAGHVDHGKTALVRALTGVDTDRLAEERRRGLTIELGFAPLELPGVGRVSLVDVPGHAQFIPTMLSGCGGLDGALFTVAADEGPMPQTAEHLDILSLLGLERGVVALTRADLASPAARAEVEARTRALTAGTFLEGAPRIFVSAVTGEGLEALRAALAAMARQVPPPPEGSPRLHVDRVFSVDGSGTVVTGTLTGGPLRRGDRVQLYPGGQTARVRGLQCHGVPAEALPPGVRAAVNLAGVRLRDVGRGDTLAAPGALALTDRTDVSLRVLPDAPFPVHTGSQLHFHHGARRGPECLYLGGIQLAVYDVVFLGYQKDKIPGADVQLTVPVIFQAVESGVVPVAPSQLDGHAAVGIGGKPGRNGQFFQFRLGGHVFHPRRYRGHSLQGLDQFGRVITFQHLAVGGKSSVEYRLNFHNLSPQARGVIPANRSNAKVQIFWLTGKKSCAAGPTRKAQMMVPAPTTPPRRNPTSTKVRSTPMRTGPKGLPLFSLSTTATRSLGPVPAWDRITMVMPKARITHPAASSPTRAGSGRLSLRNGASQAVYTSMMGPPSAMHSTVPIPT